MATVTGGMVSAERLRELGAKLGRASMVRVGFREGVDYPDGTSVAMVAAINNFGAPDAGIPPRPFFTNMITTQSPGWGATFATVLKASDNETDRALETMGLVISGELHASIVDTDQPPNSMVTNLLKSRFPLRDGMTFADVQQARADVAAGVTAPPRKPLDWTGFMLASVDSEVE